MSSWYTRAELTRRIAYLYAGNALANMFGGLLGAAILGGLEGDLGIAGWRWLFIIVRSHPVVDVKTIPVEANRERTNRKEWPPSRLHS